MTNKDFHYLNSDYLSGIITINISEYVYGVSCHAFGWIVDHFTQVTMLNFHFGQNQNHPSLKCLEVNIAFWI